MTTRIVIGGVGGANKSGLVASMHVAALWHGYNVGFHELDVFSDTHAVILGVKPAHRRNKRKVVKAPVIEAKAVDFEADTSDIVIGDLPGKVTSYQLDRLVASADGAIIVDRVPVPDDNRRRHCHYGDRWEEFFQGHQIPVIGHVQSWRPGQAVLSDRHIRLNDFERRVQPQDLAVHQVLTLVRDFASTVRADASQTA